MNFIDTIKKRARQNKKTIVLPESMDKRTFEAAEKVLQEDIANIIIIGTDEEINKNLNGRDISSATIINPQTSELTEELINEFVELRKNKGMTYDKAKELLLTDYMYYACMLVKLKKADGVVSGDCH